MITEEEKQKIIHESELFNETLKIVSNAIGLEYEPNNNQLEKILQVTIEIYRRL